MASSARGVTTIFCVCPPHAVNETGDAEVVKLPPAFVVLNATATGATVVDANAPVQVTTALLAAPASVTDTVGEIENTAVDALTALLSTSGVTVRAAPVISVAHVAPVAVDAEDKPMV